MSIRTFVILNLLGFSTLACSKTAELVNREMEGNQRDELPQEGLVLEHPNLSANPKGYKYLVVKLENNSETFVEKSYLIRQEGRSIEPQLSVQDLKSIQIFLCVSEKLDSSCVSAFEQMDEGDNTKFSKPLIVIYTDYAFSGGCSQSETFKTSVDEPVSSAAFLDSCAPPELPVPQPYPQNEVCEKANVAVPEICQINEQGNPIESTCSVENDDGIKYTATATCASADLSLMQKLCNAGVTQLPQKPFECSQK